MDVISRAFNDMFTSRRSADTGASSGWSSWSNFLGGSSSVTFGAVGYKQALTLSPVYNAVDMKSDALGMTPFGAFQKTDNGRETRHDHPVYWLLTQEPDGPDGVMTPYLWRKLIGTSLALRGNCLFKIINKSDGTVYLRYIPWDDVMDIRKVKDINGAPKHVYIVKGETLLPHEVLHYKNLSLDGVCGLSVLTYAALSMNIGIKVQEFSYANFDNKGVRQGVIETDAVLTDGKDKIRTAWRSAMQEKDPDRIVVLDGGLKFKPITVTPQEAQLIESGRFTIEDCARWFNVPLPKLKSLQQSTDNNIEQQSQDWVSDSVQPMVTAIEQEESRKLFTLAERKAGFYVEGNMNVLLRSNLKDRGDWYSKLVQMGIMTRNEAREKENMNKLDGLDEPLTPLNSTTKPGEADNNTDNE